MNSFSNKSSKLIQNTSFLRQLFILSPLLYRCYIISYHNIKFIFLNIIGSYLCQLHIILTTHCLVQISLFAIYYKVHFYGNMPGLFGVLKQISIHTADLISNIMRGACYGTTYVSLFRNSLFSILNYNRASPSVHAELYSISVPYCETVTGTCMK